MASAAPTLLQRGAATPSRRLSAAAKLRLATEIVATHVGIRRSLRRIGLSATVEALRVRPLAVGGSLNEQRRTALRLAHAVGRTLSVLPGDTRCLMRSLVLTRLLSRRGMQSTLVIGARVAPDFGAHAWVEIGGRAVPPDADAGYGRLLEL